MVGSGPSAHGCVVSTNEEDIQVTKISYAIGRVGRLVQGGDGEYAVLRSFKLVCLGEELVSNTGWRLVWATSCGRRICCRGCGVILGGQVEIL